VERHRARSNAHGSSPATRPARPPASCRPAPRT
jgi:hypothetical protein